MSEKGIHLGIKDRATLAGVGASLGIIGVKAVQANYYHDFTPSGLWNTPGELVTMVGNHVTRSVVETPPQNWEVGLQVFALAMLTYGLYRGGRALRNAWRSTNSPTVI